MKRKYNKTTWVNGKTQINAENLNNIENGISGLYTDALSIGNLKQAGCISIDALEDGDVRFSVEFRKLNSLPDFTNYPGNFGEYYQDIDNQKLYFCLDPGNWIILDYTIPTNNR